MVLVVFVLSLLLLLLLLLLPLLPCLWQVFERAVTDNADTEARELMMWASCVVGTAMGNCGVHLPHGLSYSVCGSVKVHFYSPVYFVVILS